ncbi:type I DNA topoisomerase [Rhodospirillaceae bacterium SYSU D60014]|uniref:type I DNA topoisomerase n=1 Tax=Virgifigura deserti TaxID=2268457 RepID=UPI000E66E8A5
MNVVVVESPAKAKTINKYLGPGYTVVASFGHVRDLPAKDGSVLPAEDFSMSWVVDARAETRLKEIAKAVRNADQLILATDPDREGEAISWHITEELRRRKALQNVDVKRVVFNEITKNAVLDAMRHPRTLDKELIDAYLARRALDYLVGFTLSPVLWRKLPGSRSAGRVQSVALRLVCEREAEIEAFKPREYWTVDARLRTAADTVFTARLTHLDGRKLDKFDLANEATAKAAVARLEAGDPFTVASIERKTVRRNPFAPFTTSTLQQESSRKLSLSASRTMQIAQRLYEGVDLGGETVGLITYMRTDGVQLSQEAITGARRLIEQRYGPKYLPESPRIYKTAAKNAQEAHEAIRPTDLSRRPEDVARVLDRDQLRLYELIWKRTVASQMASAVLDQVSVDTSAKGATLRATGSTLVFDGFLTLYQEDRDDPAEDDQSERRLPKLEQGERLAREAILPEQHFTQPPPRYSEASLVKKLEELGIGRPSTYASILQVLQDRDYVRLDKRRFIPEDRGRVVTAFLTSFFERYVEYNFTAELEEQLDDISGGRIDWKTVLREFWSAFSQAVEGTKDLSIGQVIETLDEELGRHFFPESETGANPRACPACQNGRLSLKLGKFGAFVGCSNYPECRYTRRLAIEGENGEADAELTGPKELGQDPATGLPVSLRKGPYGTYVQLGETPANGDGNGKAKDKTKEKPKRVSLPRGMSPAELSLDKALALLALPREIGRHPESGETITAGIGRFGPYLKRGAAYKSLPRDEDVLTIGLNRAVDLLADVKTRGRGGDTGNTVGEHPADNKPITLHSGRYGPYLRHGKLLASVPKSMDADTLTIDQAVEILAAQAEKKGKKPAKKTNGAANGAAKPKAKAKTKAKAKAKPKAPGRKAATASGAAESES